MIWEFTSHIIFWLGMHLYRSCRTQRIRRGHGLYALAYIIKNITTDIKLALSFIFMYQIIILGFENCNSFQLGWLYAKLWVMMMWNATIYSWKLVIQQDIFSLVILIQLWCNPVMLYVLNYYCNCHYHYYDNRNNNDEIALTTIMVMIIVITFGLGIRIYNYKLKSY